MFVLIERYINNTSINDFNNLAISKGIIFTKEELDFSYNFIQKNWQNILSNKDLFDINKYQEKFTKENFIKIKKLYNELLLKYSKYIK
jgi:hypothetical protein